MLTKTQLEILKVFCSKLTESFSIRSIAQQLNKKYKVIYQASQDLIKRDFLEKDKKHKLLKLNYQRNLPELAYIESLRAEQFLKKHPDINLFIDETIKKINLGFFTILLFGSYVESKQTKRSDIDILMIIENLEDTEKIERQLQNISEKYGNFHSHVISQESVREMIKERTKLNVINETLDKHILFFGAENYYRLIS